MLGPFVVPRVAQARRRGDHFGSGAIKRSAKMTAGFEVSRQGEGSGRNAVVKLESQNCQRRVSSNLQLSN